MDEFSLLNAVLASVLCFSSALIGGYLSDKYQTDDPLTKSRICILSSLGAAPFITLSFLINDNFWASILMLAANYLIAEAWSAPTITMLLDTTSQKNQGFTVNAYLLFGTMAGVFSTSILDWLNN